MLKEEFGLKNLDKLEGAKRGVLVASIFIVVPILIFNVLPLLLGAKIDGTTGPLLLIALILGVPSALVAFLNGSYPKGSWPRAIFGIILGSLSFLYVLVVIPSEGLQTYFSDLGMPIDVDRLLLVLVYVPVLFIASSLLELHFSRGAFLNPEKKGEEMKIPERGLKDEFNPRHGSYTVGTKEVWSKYAILVLGPAVALIIICAFILSSHFHNLDALSVSAYRMVDLIVLLGIPGLAISYVHGHYPKGSVPRASAGLIFALYMTAYYFLVLLGTGLQEALTDAGMDWDINRILILVILTSVFIGLEAVGELIDERKNWKRSIGHEIKERKTGPNSVKIEFDPRNGKIADGVKQAFRAYIAFVLVPTLLVVVASGITDDLNLSHPAMLQLAYGRIYDCILLFGIILLALNFVRGLYPKGSAGRFAFGLATIPFTVFFASTILLSTGLEGALQANGLHMVLADVLPLILIYAFYIVIIEVAVLVDNRRRWSRSIGRRVKEWKAEEGERRIHDFRVRYANFTKGTKYGRKGLTQYIVIPSLLIILARALLYSLEEFTSTQTGFGMPSISQAAADMVSRLEMLNTFLILIGLGIAACMLMRNSYPKGSYPRMVFTCGSALGMAVWTYSLYATLDMGSGFSIPTIGSLSFITSIMSFVLLAIIILAAIRSILAVLELRSNREEFIDFKKAIIKLDAMEQGEVQTEEKKVVAVTATEGPSEQM